MNRLEGKIALITGGTSGMGAATARLFQTEGAQVIATGSAAASVEKARSQMPNLKFVHSDAADTRVAQSLVEHVRETWGRIDVLFVNAGIARLIAIEDTDEAAFDRLFDVNVRGPYFLIKHAIPVLSDGASIILTSSLAAVRGIAQHSAYGASKAALRSLGITLAVELAPRGIRVNTITPGPINTGIGAKMNLTPKQLADAGSLMLRVPLNRVGAPDEIAAAALYFASDDSRFTTGTEMPVDGGATAY